MALLEVQNLKTYYYTLRGYVKAVDGASFKVEKGEAMGLAGESGCGKTTIALSLLRILPPGGKIIDGKIIFEKEDLVKKNEKEMRDRIRWKKISLIFQGAMNALNPVYKIEDQIVEAILAHEKNVTKREAIDRAKKLFELVGLDPLRISNYPHEFSGGMRQRAMIAMALACNPELLIADEPGTALDVIIQAQILKLLRELKDKFDLSMILITHDLSIIADTCQTCAIMYGGEIVEYGDVVTLFKKPIHPYTTGLISAFPNVKSEKSRMLAIPGAPPDLLNPPKGCKFHPRCQYTMKVCREKEPALLDVGRGHLVACHLVEKA
jgi:peptide/nickel transport system ATP-binding protein